MRSYTTRSHQYGLDTAQTAVPEQRTFAVVWRSIRGSRRSETGT
ncbi:hypothetical protein HSR121_1067 [Halapricum desulfuricans]|uniref:Uncharacterized protein n=1 Tax=Halapricum desulfuricans TaxID=2841257 RepID=A0A897MY76_9EURY|nr:hypothetical protein HSR121_1067 [Halapricum desulfuricans]